MRRRTRSAWTVPLIVALGCLIPLAAGSRAPWFEHRVHAQVSPLRVETELRLPRTVAQPAPHLAITQFTPEDRDIGGPFLFVRGLVTNEGPGPAQSIRVKLGVRRDAGGPIVAEGFGEGWLDVLAAGESGPFTVGVRFCCRVNVADYQFDVEALPAEADRYRALEVLHVVTQTLPSGDVLLVGDLRNTGQAYLDATATRVNVGFWRGDELVELNPARLPVVAVSGGPGQSHPPGFVYPWSIPLPAVPYDRVQVWPSAEAYPPGFFPIPLGVRDVHPTPTADGYRLEATLFNCGLEASQNMVVMVVARDAPGRPLDFAARPLDVSGPLAPGAEGTIDVTWSSNVRGIDPAAITVTVWDLDGQAERPPQVPARWPCPPKSRIWLPIAQVRTEAMETAVAPAPVPASPAFVDVLRSVPGR